MQKVLTTAEMREVDRLTTERYGIPSIILMENAAHAVARVITKKLDGSVKGKSILVLCGKGNNGGDGAALSRILSDQGAYVCAVLIGRVADTKDDARSQFEILKNLEESRATGLDFWEFEDYSKAESETVRQCKFDLVVDALFGTGLTRKLDEPYSSLFLDLNEIEAPCLSVDLPSGLNADLPDPIGVVFSSQYTVTFTAPKPASILPPAAGLGGELFVASIGSPRSLIEQQPSQLYVGERYDALLWLKRSGFAPASYKNKRGHALIVAGSENYSGAAVLCGNAAMRSGVGLITVGTPRSSKDSIAGRVLPEVMVRPLAETETGAVSEEAIAEVEDFSRNINAMAIGAGLSANDESTRRFVRHFVENRTMPTILDADALTLMAPFQRVNSPFGIRGSDGDGSTEQDQDPPVILTPHEGEFMRLLGTDDKEAIKDRVAAVRKFAQEKNVILLLKGERNLIGHPDGRVVVNPTGNSGLGKAGNGDTLLGILTGFVAQAAAMRIDIFETVVAAVYVAGLAGDIAAEKYGKRVMTASDTRECLAEAFRRCEVEIS